ncbi:hypothetical protein [Arthrobacter sp. YN]|nr:hypothetical protein [Arthrobacter sp. YN]
MTERAMTDLIARGARPTAAFASGENPSNHLLDTKLIERKTTRRKR